MDVAYIYAWKRVRNVFRFTRLKGNLKIVFFFFLERANAIFLPSSLGGANVGGTSARQTVHARSGSEFTTGGRHRDRTGQREHGETAQGRGIEDNGGGRARDERLRRETNVGGRSNRVTETEYTTTATIATAVTVRSKTPHGC